MPTLEYGSPVALTLLADASGRSLSVCKRLVETG